jgi:hypothetical protein
MQISAPKKNAPTKDIRKGALMVDDGSKSFPTGDSTRPFSGKKSLVHGVGVVDPNNIPWTGKNK